MDNYKLSGNAPLEGVDLAEVRKKYNDPHYWTPRDKWHQLTTELIGLYIQKKLPLSRHALVLNLGSGGNSYGVNDVKQVHVDIALRRIGRTGGSVGGDINHLPIRSNTADFVICVGGVINYASPRMPFQKFAG
jgi:hypothetical protein